MTGRSERGKQHGNLVCHDSLQNGPLLKKILRSQVRAFISLQADEDSVSDEEDSSEETELDLSNRKRQAIECTPLLSAKQPSRLDLLLERLNAEIEIRRSELKALPHPSEFHMEPPRKKRRIVRSQSPEQSSSSLAVAKATRDVPSSEDLIDGLQLGRELDEILTNHSSGSQQDDEEYLRRCEWDRLRTWVDIVIGQTPEVFQYGVYYVRCRVSIISYHTRQNVC